MPDNGRSVAARDVATRMRAIEDNVSGETGQDSPPLDRVVAVLLDIDYDGLHAVLTEETARVLALMENWYTEHGIRLTPDAAAALGFVQGVTFAVAAQRLHADA